MQLSEILKTHPLTEKLNLYLVSLLGVIEADDIRDPAKRLDVFFHNANFYYAPTLAVAKDMACAEAADMYPPANGWKLRSVSVHPVAPEYIAQIVNFWTAGALNQRIVVEETGDMFNCDQVSDQPAPIIDTETPPF